MNAEIFDLDQFFQFCQIQNCLISIIEENHQILSDQIDTIFKKSKQIILNSLKKDSYLKSFCNLNKLSIIDLDLLQIALSEQTKNITPEQYLEKSIFESYDKSKTSKIINKVSKSRLIKKKYLIFNNPFNNTDTINKELMIKILKFLNLSDNVKSLRVQEKIKLLNEKKLFELNKDVFNDKYNLMNSKDVQDFKLKLIQEISRYFDMYDNDVHDVIQLLNSSLGRKRSKKKFKLEFSVYAYNNFDYLLKDVYLLDKILNASIDNQRGFSKKNLDFLYIIQLRKIELRYKKTLKKNIPNFSHFLKKNKIQFNDLFLIINLITDDYRLNKNSYSISNELFLRFKDKSSINKLLKAKIIRKNYGLELTKDAIKELLNIDLGESKMMYRLETSNVTFKQISLSNDIKKRIFDVINQHKNKNLIFNKWGLGESIGYGKGITLNFSGPPGTGKTLTVKAISNYLNKKLIIINYAELESKWVGETEKNIVEVFEIAKKKDAILFFDEADSLTTSRLNALKSWEISRTNTLLKELENFEGVCIFATNFAENYDKAFNRRLSAHIKFRLPEKEQLKDIFEIHFPKKKALCDKINFLEIAKKFNGVFSGGDIKNVVLNAARIASNDKLNKKMIIKQSHLLQACEIVVHGKKTTSSQLCEPTYFG